MATFEEDLYSWLSSYGGLVALGNKVHPQVLPENPALPATTYQRISTEETYTHDGIMDLHPCKVQFDVYAKAYKLSRQVAAQLRAAIQALPGYHGIYIKSDRDMYDQDPRNFRVMIEAKIWIRE